MRHRILHAATDRAARFRPLLDELASLPAAAVVVVLNERNTPSPRGGRWCEAQVVRMRKVLAAGPRRRTQNGTFGGDRMYGKERQHIDNANRIRAAAGS
jgi:hypothetical protein